MDVTAQDEVVLTVKRSDLEWHVNRLVIAEDHIKSLKEELDTLKNTNHCLEYCNKILIGNYVKRNEDEETLKKENAELKEQVKDLTQKLASESKRADANTKMLLNERQQYKESKKTLKTKFTQNKQQLEREIVELKKCKLLAIQSALEALNKRAEILSTKFPKPNGKRKEFQAKFQALKTKNDRMMRDLESVKFTSRLYQNDHKSLVKLQEHNDKKYSDHKSKIGQISSCSKKLLEEYNKTIPQRFLQDIGDYVRDLDLLEKTDFNSDFVRELELQDKVLNLLAKEGDMLDSILTMEKTNGQTTTAKKKNLDIVNNLDLTYTLLISGLPEMDDHLWDIMTAEKIMSEAAGRHIGCCNLERLGVQSKTPRPLKVVLKTKKDYDDVLDATKGNRYVLINDVQRPDYGQICEVNFKKYNN